jgi:manganese-dependent ADP-ribose/CDP-alcohol diphosphatase
MRIPLRDFMPVIAVTLALGTAATALPLSPATAAPKTGEGKPLFEFGVVADVQYCDCDTKGTRNYRGSLQKLSEAAAVFNDEDLAFTIQTGDLIDRNRESFDRILPVWEQIEGPRHHMLGNHDFPVYTDEVKTILGMPNQYHDFSQDGFRFVALDTNDISTYANAPGSPKHGQAENVLATKGWEGDSNAQSWNGGVGEEQMRWFENVLTDAEAKGEKTVVLGHMPVAPANEHNAWNDSAIIATMERHQNVVAYLNGHNHVGNYVERNGIHYVNLEGMVEQDTNAYSVIKVHEDRLVIDGYGREPDRQLKFASE